METIINFAKALDDLHANSLTKAFMPGIRQAAGDTISTRLILIQDE